MTAEPPPADKDSTMTAEPPPAGSGPPSAGPTPTEPGPSAAGPRPPPAGPEGPLINYHGPRKFMEGSPLRFYLGIKDPARRYLDKEEVTLNEVLLSLKDVISMEKLYDEKNQAIILGDKALETAINCKACHLTEIRDIVCRQLIATGPPKPAQPVGRAPATSASTTGSQPATRVPAASSAATGSQKTTTTSHTLGFITFEMPFEIKEEFRAVLRTLPEFPSGRKIFQYGELTKLLSQYILKNKGRLFDDRNIKVAICEGDLLGEAFGVRAFHRTQVSSLLRSQLIVPKVGPPTEEPVQQPGAAVNPPPPEAGPSQAPESAPKDTLTTALSSGEETIYSEQGNETTDIKELSPPDRGSSATSSEEEDDAPNGTEFEVDSSESGGQDQAGPANSDEDSEIADVVFLASEVLIHEGSDFWADSSSEEGPPSKVLRGQERAVGGPGASRTPSLLGRRWKCLRCDEPNQEAKSYCDRCWEERQESRPPRPSPGRRRRPPPPAGSAPTPGVSPSYRVPTPVPRPSATSLRPTQSREECRFCFRIMDPAVLVHGKIAHQACCYPCAKRLMRERKPCPLCRRKVEKICRLIGHTSEADDRHGERGDAAQPPGGDI